MKKLLTKKQIEAYQLVSGEFEGLSTADAAMKMSITSQALNRLLKRAEKICPSIFPLLSVQEAHVATLLTYGYNNYDLANQLGVSLSRVSQIINSLYAKRPSMVVACQQIKIVRYAAHLDNQIKVKF